MTHPHLQVREDPDDADTYVAAPGHMAFPAGTGGPNADNTKNLPRLDGTGTEVTPGQTLKAWRDSADFKHCEVLSREDCQARHDNSKFRAAADQDVFSECVASSLVPAVSDANAAGVHMSNPLMMYSAAYIAEKTGDDLDIDQAICRWSGDFAGLKIDGTADEKDRCDKAYRLVRDGHFANPGATDEAQASGTHTGYQYQGVDAYSTFDMGSSPKYNEDIEDGDTDVEVDSAANRGGKYWLRVGEQNKDIQALRNVRHGDLLPEDIEAVSVAALAYYAAKLAGDDHYAPADTDTLLTDDQKENRRVLLEAIPGDCFSAGISEGLLYSGGWGAAYFSLGLLLVIAHFVWFYAAMSDDKEGLRFMVRGAGRRVDAPRTASPY